MTNDIFDYSYQYRIWHDESVESQDRDKQAALWTFKNHNLFPQDKNAKILEIGCGMGRVMLMLQESGFRNLKGVDIDKSQIDIAKRADGGLEVYLCDGLEFLKKDKNLYNAIYAFDVLEHIAKEKQLEFLKEICSHLSDDGILAMQFPNAMAPTMGFYRYSDFTHTCSYTHQTNELLLHNAGFHFFEVRPTHTESSRIQKLKRPWALLYKEEFGLENPILTPNLFVVAFKNQNSFDLWKQAAPKIHNEYKEPKRHYLARKIAKWLDL